jgi:hypothetical protein
VGDIFSFVCLQRGEGKRWGEEEVLAAARGRKRRGELGFPGLQDKGGGAGGDAVGARTTASRSRISRRGRRQQENQSPFRTGKRAKRERRDGPEERGRKVGLEREPSGWAGRGIGAGQREGERPREGFCFKKRKDEGFIKPYEKETN